MCAHCDPLCILNSILPNQYVEKSLAWVVVAELGYYRRQRKPYTQNGAADGQGSSFGRFAKIAGLGTRRHRTGNPEL